jgi:WD40 repeat protein
VNASWLAAIFEQAEVPAGPRELADALWLAAHLTGERARPTAPDPAPAGPPAFPPRPAGQSGPVPQRVAAGPAAPPARRAPQPPLIHALGRSGTDSADRRDALLTRSPAAVLLPGGLDLMRALRPLKRSVPSSTEWDLDEQATAEGIAADRIVMPVRRPASERWLTLTLMVDSGRSMVIWDPVVDGLRVLLERFGGFRDVRVRYLHTDTADRVFVHARRPGRNLEHSPAEVIDPTGRQAILIVSDCVGDAWWSGTLGPVLEMWGRQGPVAILQPLPQQWWTRTGIVPVPTRLHSASPGLANHRIRAEGRAGHAGIPVPLLEIESEWLAAWAGLVAGTGPGGVPALAAFTGAPPPPRWPAFATQPSARERVLQFRSAATPQAFRLAGFLALTPLALPVMRLVQQAMLPQSKPSHLAEVFLSGLLRAAANDAGHHELATYDFTGNDVREELLGTVRRSDAVQVLTRVSQYLGSRIAADAEFASLIPVRAGTGDRELSSSLGAFGWLPSSTLQRLGGGYAAVLGDSAGTGLRPRPAQGHPAPLPAEPGVYLAHSSEDGPWPASLVARLQADGFLVQADSWSAGPADPYLHARRELVSRADVIVVLYGRGIAGLADAAARCAALVAIAEEHATPVIPLLIEDVEADPVISSLVWLDGRDGDRYRAGEALAAALRGLRGGPAAHGPGPGPAAPADTSPVISIGEDHGAGPGPGLTADLSASGVAAGAGGLAGPGAGRETRTLPPAQNWAAAVYLSRDSPVPAGSALVVDERRVLTCAHLVGGESAVAATLWVAFAGTEPGAGERRPVREVVSGGDLAMLVLAATTPAGVIAAPLRCPRPLDLPGRACWASGFPDGSGPVGQSASGEFSEALPRGRIRLRSDGQEYLRPGFCGSGLWSPDYQAAVAVLCSADVQGDSQAVTLHQAALSMPGEALRELAAWSAAAADEHALAAWGWSLDTDPEGVQHWRPRARGVTADSERGYRFRGRTAALRAIVAWLDRPVADGQALLVTGMPGAGKSAVLGRIVTTADTAAAGALPPDDPAVRATPGSVACAVHVKGKTALEVAIEIARAASASLPDQLDEFAVGLRDALAGHGGRFNVLIDALDEAASPKESRAIVASVIRPLAETCADVGAQVVVGTRRGDPGSDLIAACGRAVVIDLDDPGYLDSADLADYALATLQLAGDERPTPYADDRVARPLAQRIADLSGGNFLVAGLTARAHALHDREAADPAQVTFTATVDATMHAYLRRIPPVAGVKAEAVLTALAFAEAPGMPLSVWRAAAAAIAAASLTDEQLSQFARSASASFLTQSGQDGGTPVFRLFHQALNDTLLEARSRIAPPEQDEQAITWSLMRLGRSSGWDHAPAYLLRSLASHAARAGMIDQLLSDRAYLLHADLFRLIPLADGALMPAGQRRARLLRLTPRAIAADPLERAALLSVTETIEKLGNSFTTSLSPAPYRARWALFAPRTELAVLEGHSERVAAVCALTIRGRALLASGGGDGMIRIWDPGTGTSQAALRAHAGTVAAICSLAVDGRTLLASGGGDGMIRIWDPDTGTSQAALRAHAGTVAAICSLAIDGRTLLASGGGDGMIRIWDPYTGTSRAIQAHERAVSCLCAVVDSAGRLLLASGSYDGTLRTWDAATGELQANLDGHDISVDSFASFISAGRWFLVSGGGDGTIRTWDPATGASYGALPAYKGPVASVCALGSDFDLLLAGGGIDGAVRVWDPSSGTLRATLRGHTMSVDSMCTLATGGRVLLASGGGDGTIRIWDPATGADEADRDSGTMVSAVCALPAAGPTLLASGGDDGAIRTWDPLSGRPMKLLPSHNSPIHCLCPVTDRRGTMLAAGTGDGWIRIWDPDAATSRVSLRAHRSSVNCLCTLAGRGRTLLASGGGDRAIRIWDPAAGTSLRALRGHNSSVNCLCALTSRGQTLLASGAGRELQIWDPASGASRILATDGSPVSCLCALTLSGRALLVSGMHDGTVHIWDPRSGDHLAALRGHDGLVTAVCVVAGSSSALLASASDDRTVRIWAPGAGGALLTVPIYSPARSVAYVDGLLVVSTAAGLLTIELSEHDLVRP